MNFKKNLILSLILILFTVPAYFSLLRPGFYSMHDDLQAFRILEMNECVKDLQLPCRWVPNSGYQFGYPLFIFYPPSAYYVGELVHLLGFQFLDATKAVFIIGFITSALGMYLFLKEYLKKTLPAFVGALIYTYAPYRAVNVYVRGALSEFFALTFFPLIFWSIYKLIKTERLRYMAFFALSLGGLLYTHNLMTLLFAPVALVWTLLVIIQEKKWRIIPKVVIAGLIGVMLAASFSLPVAVEKNYVHLESIISGYFDYRMHFADINQIFFSTFWGYGSSVWGPYDGLSLSTGQLQWFLGIVALVFALFHLKKHKKLSVTTLTLVVLELGVLFMMHQKSSFIWSKLPFLAYIQFPWRLLGVSIFLLSILGAFVVSFMELEIPKPKKIFNISIYPLLTSVIIIIGLLVININFFKPKAWINISDHDKFSGKSWEKQLTISIFDYLPIYAKLPPISKAPQQPEVLEGKVNFLSYTKGSDFQYGKLNVFSKSALIRLPLFDFPGMEVKVDNKVVPHTHQDCRNEPFCYGLISVGVPEGKHNLAVKLENTADRTAGNILSLVAVFIITGLFLADKKWKK